MVASPGLRIECSHQDSRRQHRLQRPRYCQPRAAYGDQLGSAPHPSQRAGCLEAIAQRQTFHRARKVWRRPGHELIHAAAWGGENHRGPFGPAFARAFCMREKPASRVRWFLIGWLFVLSAVAFLDRVNLSIAGGSLSAEYHLSNVQFGLLSTALLIGYTLFQAPAGWLADRFGPRRVLTGAVLWWGVFTALTAAIPSSIGAPLAALIAVRFLLGAGEAIIYPASNQFVSRWIPTQERGFANGLIFAGVGAGSGLSPFLVIYTMAHHGWRFSFWVCALIGCAAGLVWYLAARDTPEKHPQVSQIELAKIQSGLTLGSQTATPSAPPPPCPPLLPRKAL